MKQCMSFHYFHLPSLFHCLQYPFPQYYATVRQIFFFNFSKAPCSFFPPFSFNLSFRIHFGWHFFWGKWLLQLSTPPGPGTPFMWSCCTLYFFLDFIIIVTCMFLPLECELHVGDDLCFSITTLSLIPGYVLDILVKLNKYLLNELMNDSFQVQVTGPNTLKRSQSSPETRKRMVFLQIGSK